MEQKKGFFEDGGGFDRIWDGTIGRLDNAFKHFGKTRLATLLGMVLVTCMVVCLICDTFVGEVSLQLRNRDLRKYLQHDAGLPEAAGISEREFDMVSDVLDNVADGWALMWTVDHFKDDYYLEPFSEAEITLLEECTILLERLRDWYDYGNGTSLALVLGWTVGAGCLLKKRSKRILQAVLLGTGIGLLPFAFAAVCFARDFSQALQYFCGSLFSVDLTLLTPETSLLVRLFPQSVLEGIGQNILYQTGLMLAVKLGILFVFTLIFVVAETWSKRKKLKEDETNETAHL